MLLAMRDTLIDALEAHLLLVDFPAITTKGSELKVPFEACFKVEKLGGLVL
jgi:pre-mRNA-processing factor 8